MKGSKAGKHVTSYTNYAEQPDNIKGHVNISDKIVHQIMVINGLCNKTFCLHKTSLPEKKKKVKQMWFLQSFFFFFLKE